MQFYNVKNFNRGIPSEPHQVLLVMGSSAHTGDGISVRKKDD